MRGFKRVWLIPGLMVAGAISSAEAQSPATTSKPKSATLNPSVAADTPETAEDRQARLAAERYLALLERQPRLGTALDRIYGYHVERGTLDGFVAQLKERLETPAEAGAAAMILGLVESQRGKDAEAVTAFQRAETERPDDPLASYYLGRSLLLVGQTEEGAKAYERALDRKPARADFLEIAQTLGRNYQRARQTEAALKVWDRLEKTFPNDARVQEQIATILSDEGDAQGALTRFEKLAATASDPYRKVQYQLQVGALKFKLGKSEEGLKILEGLLSQLKPDSWLHRDVRQKIEETFLRTDDYDGLVKYYENWLKKQPDDLDVIVRLGKLLSLQSRAPEAEKQYRRAIAVAPSNKALRRSLIDLLVQAERVPEALKEYAELDRLEPNHPDTLRAWGSLTLTDKSQPEAARRKSAVEIWKRLLVARPKDPVIAGQVADLFRQAKMTEEAIAQYEQAIALAPNEPQYREYLGEYLHSLERRDEAVANWKEIATGNKRNTRNLVRLAEVYRGFGYREESVKTMGEACALDPEFADILRYAELLQEGLQFDEALAQIARAEKLTDNEDEADQVLFQKIKVFTEAGRLTEEIDKLVQLPFAKTADGQRTLALYYEAARQITEAGAAITKALELDPQSLRTWMVAARLYESTGQIAKAVEANEKLATLDRRARSDYLQRIANLNLRLGRVDAALQAGRDVIAAAPGNPEAYQFYAGLCFGLGKNQEGLDALRRSVRVNPSDPQALLRLAASLADQFRTDEAIELYWRAFEASEDLESQNSVITSLTELYLRTNHFDQLITKLKRTGEEQKKERDTQFWLTAAYQAGGDIGAARQTLEAMLDESSKDTALLQQLVQLADIDFDLDRAIAYQKRIQELSPTRESLQQLASLYLRAGQTDEAEAIWLEIVGTSQERYKIYEAVDTMLQQERYEAATKLTDKLLRERPDDWEALYRAGYALWKQEKIDSALEKFEQIRALKLPDDQLSAKAEHQKAEAEKRKSLSLTTAPPQRFGFGLQDYPQSIRRMNQFYQVAQTFNQDPNRYYGYQQSIWAPGDYGEAAMLAPTLRFTKDVADGKSDEALARLHAIADNPKASHEELWEVVYLAGISQQVLSQSGSNANPGLELSTKVSRRLSEGSDAGGKILYLSTLRQGNIRQVVRNGVVTLEPTKKITAEEIAHILKCYEEVQISHPQLIEQAGISAMVIAALNGTDQKHLAEKFYQNYFDKADDARKIPMAFQLASTLNKVDDQIVLIERLEALPGSATGHNAPFQYWMQLSQRFTAEDWPRALGFAQKAIRARAKQVDASPPQKQALSTNQSQGTYYVSYQVGTNYQSTQLDYPAINHYFDQSAIQQLYQLFRQAKDKKTVNELTQAFEDMAKKSTGTEQALATLLTTYFTWWDGQKDQAIQQMVAISKLQPDDTALRLQLAGLFLRQQQPQAALAQLEGLSATDHLMLRDKELLAVQCAVAIGDLERARKGAERLYGLQLDSGVQFQLAQLMHQLGMHDQADNLLTRMRKRSGNQVGTLVQVMQQYANQGNSDVAAQIAHQLLRRSRPNPTANRRNGITQDMQARTQALNMLGRTKQLDKLIARAEDQLTRSPDSRVLLETLAEYYQANGQAEKSQAMLDRIAKKQPDDARSLYQLGHQLTAANKLNEACDAYLKAIVKDPGELENRYYELRNTFQRAKRIPDMAKAFETMDLKPMRRFAYRLGDIVGELTRQDQTREAGLTLFRRVWKEMPQQRLQLIGSLYDDKIWEVPEMFEYAREAIVPTSKKGSLTGSWDGLPGQMSWNGDGRVTTLLTRLVQATKPAERRKQFTEDVQKALADHPEWKTGEVLLVVMEARDNNMASAEKRVEKLLADKTMPGNVAMTLGQELGELKVMQPQVIQLLEFSTQSSDQSSHDFSYHPQRYLARMKGNAGDRHEARRLILKLLDQQDYSRYGTGNPGYPEYQHLQSCHAAAQDFMKLNMPLDAIRLYDQALSDPAKFQAASRWGGNYLERQITEGKQNAVKALTPEVLTDSLKDWLQFPADKPADALQPNPVIPAIVEFSLNVQPRTADTARIVSLFETAVEAAAGKGVALTTPVETQAQAQQSPVQRIFSSFSQRANRKPVVSAKSGQKQVPEALQVLREQLIAARQDYDDVSLAIAEALVRFDLPDAATEETLLPLMKQITVKSVSSEEAKSAKGTENVLAPWLAARRALTHASPAVQAEGERIAQECLQVGRSLPDTLWVLAMLRERGQIAADAGDKRQAEAYWAEMLDLILKVPEIKGAVPTATSLTLPAPTLRVTSAVRTAP